jgi:hypothetical protein
VNVGSSITCGACGGSLAEVVLVADRGSFSIVGLLAVALIATALWGVLYFVQGDHGIYLVPAASFFAALAVALGRGKTGLMECAVAGAGAAVLCTWIFGVKEDIFGPHRYEWRNVEKGTEVVVRLLITVLPYSTALAIVGGAIGRQASRR